MPNSNASLLATLTVYTWRGWKLHPCRAKSDGEKKTKTPLTRHWKDEATDDPEQISKWMKQYPGCMWGVATGQASGIWALDVDDPQKFQDFRSEHRLELPETLTQRTPSGGLHYFFRMAEGVRNSVKNKIPGCDTRGDGGYAIIAPSYNQDTGVAYELINPEAPIADAPAWLLERVTEEKKKPLPPMAGKPAISILLYGTPYGIAGLEKETREFLATPEGGRNDYLNIYAMKVAQLVAGRQLDEQFARAEVEKAAQRYADDDGWNQALATINSGWKKGMTEPRIPPERNTGQAQIEKPETEPLEITEGAAADECSIPESCLHPGGLLQMLMDYTDQSNVVSHHVYSLAGAIAAVGTLAGQKFMTDTNLRTNFYVLALGGSGTGKDAPQSAITEAFQRSCYEAEELIAGHSLTSEAALLRWLADKHNGLYLFDEIGLFLSAMKRPQSPAAEVPAILMKLFTGADRSYTKHYADKQNHIHVAWHHASFYGASTPERFWESMTRTEATDGFLARCLIFESRHDLMFPKEHVIADVPEELCRRITELAKLVYVWDDTPGNLEQKPLPRKILKDDEAAALFSEWAKKYFLLAKKYSHTDEGLVSVYLRAAEHAHKLALVHAISLDGIHVDHVGKDSVKWACDLVDAILANTVKQIENNIAESDFHKLTQRCIKAIRGYMKSHRGKPGSPRWAIEKNLKGVDSQIVDRVLKKLIHEGCLEERKYDSQNGTHGTLYCLCRVKDS